MIQPHAIRQLSSISSLGHKSFMLSDQTR